MSVSISLTTFKLDNNDDNTRVPAICVRGIDIVEYTYNGEIKQAHDSEQIKSLENRTIEIKTQNGTRKVNVGRCFYRFKKFANKGAKSNDVFYWIKGMPHECPRCNAAPVNFSRDFGREDVCYECKKEQDPSVTKSDNTLKKESEAVDMLDALLKRRKPTVLEVEDSFAGIF